MSRSVTPVVVALGGNALSPPGRTGAIREQFERTERTAERLAEVVAAGHRLCITHGNGPQVGSELRRVELAAGEVYTLPLHICVADTQGGMGYMIAQCLDNALHRHGLTQGIVPIVTTVEVADDDPAFEHPDKPIGRYLDADEAEMLRRANGCHVVEVEAGRFRRVVASPMPRRIVEIELIKRMIANGELVIAAGGGGIPVMLGENGDYSGCEAVIDKDRTSALLAAAIGTHTLMLVTSVSRVALDFGTPEERFIERMTVSEARAHLAAGQFPPGSMGPKIEAAIDYLERSPGLAARVIICDIDHIGEALAGRDGTCICNGC